MPKPPTVKPALTADTLLLYPPNACTTTSSLIITSSTSLNSLAVSPLSNLSYSFALLHNPFKMPSPYTYCFLTLFPPLPPNLTKHLVNSICYHIATYYATFLYSLPPLHWVPQKPFQIIITFLIKISFCFAYCPLIYLLLHYILSFYVSSAPSYHCLTTHFGNL